MNSENEIQRLKLAVEELSLLNELAIAASSSSDIQKTLNIIIQKSIKAVGAEQGNIKLLSGHADRLLETVIHQENISHGGTAFRVGDHIIGWVLAHQQPLMIENLAADPRFHVSAQESQDIHTVLSVPILFSGKIIGVLTLTNKKTKKPFNQDDQRLMSILASQAGQLIRNSQLQEDLIRKKQLEHELQIARQIQLSLLPRENPKIEQLDFASHFEPFQAVGGDYYDYFYLADDTFGLVIADVSGHGPSAAMVMTMTKGIMHSLKQHYQQPDKILTELNTSLFGLIPRNIFITMTFFIFDLDKKVLKFSNAGHVPFVYYDRKQNSSQLIGLRGAALNLSRTSTYIIQELPIQNGDIFLLYTDGVTETSNPAAELFGFDRLVESLQELKGHTAQGIITNLRTRLESFSQKSTATDDVVLISIKIQNK
jgi:sigma-B regulation protein RsbU (phosphoserine phosphatase)